MTVIAEIKVLWNRPPVVNVIKLFFEKIQTSPQLKTAKIDHLKSLNSFRV